jgi:hypothetical protein
MIKEFKFFEGIGFYRLSIRSNSDFRFLTGHSNELRITTTGEIVRGRTRRLRATWTREPIEDLQAYHGIDAEEELTRMLSQQWAEEIDRTVMRTLLDTINTENETDMEVLRGTDVLNDNHELDATEMIIDELTRLINGGNRA